MSIQPVCRSFLAVAPLVVAGLLWVNQSAGGQEFRIDTEIFVGDEKEPQAVMLTIFKGGLIYDFQLAAPREITIFDPQRDRFMLLDPARKWKATVSSQAVFDYAVDFDAHAAKSNNPLFAFAAEPKFETTVEEYDENGQQLTRLSLVGKPLSYQAIARHPEKPEAVAAYRHFADWYARLNATRSGNLPTRARLDLNKALAERQLIPLEITRTIDSGRPLARKLEVKSRHLVNWVLSTEDERRIQQAGTDLNTFESVDFEDYRAAPPLEAAPTTASAQKPKR